MDEKEWTEEITAKNCGEKLKLIRKVLVITRAEISKIIGCSESVVARIEIGKTLASEDFRSRLNALSVIGYHRFKELSEAQKESVGKSSGKAGGSLGLGEALAAVSASGVAGLSAAGVTSGLTAIGIGSLVGGLAIVATIPVAAGFSGFGLVKALQKIADANNLTITEIDEKWEIIAQPPEQTKTEK